MPRFRFRLRPFRAALLCVGVAAVLGAPSLAAAQDPQRPAGPAAALPLDDPSVVRFDTDIGLLLVPVRAAATDDYEALIRQLQAALAASADPLRRRQAAGWRVFKANEADAKGQAIYVHLISPVAAGADYRPSAVLDDLVEGAPEALLVRYRDAHAGPPSKLSLAEFANMSVAPAAPAPAITPPS